MISQNSKKNLPLEIATVVILQAIPDTEATA